jgi:bifunctional NMN adenylyltransferase/nudix hydrolase
MSKKYDTIVYIGRFQPLHNAHVTTLQKALTLANKVVVVVGSAYQPRTYKNPFSAAERALMLSQVLLPLCDQEDADAVIEYNRDSLYNDQAWATRVQELVYKHTKPNSKIGIIGHNKDESTFYLDLFPQWTFEEVGQLDPLNATDVRDLYFKPNCNMQYLRSVIPNEAFEFLTNFKNSAGFEQIVKEREFIANYKKQFGSLTYAPTFVTADAVVICSGHVLMIQRRAEPGKGLWALPGGFLNAATDRSMEDCMLRELREETGIKVPVPVLRGSIQCSQVFDAIDRSARGRTITHAFKILLPPGKLPKVKGHDDAARAKWIPIAEVRSEYCFEDHYEIIMAFLGA